jgi:hypothetical protein
MPVLFPFAGVCSISAPGLHRQGVLGRKGQKVRDIVIPIIPTLKIGCQTIVPSNLLDLPTISHLRPQHRTLSRHRNMSASTYTAAWLLEPHAFFYCIVPSVVILLFIIHCYQIKAAKQPWHLGSQRANLMRMRLLERIHSDPATNGLTYFAEGTFWAGHVSVSGCPIIHPTGYYGHHRRGVWLTWVFDPRSSNVLLFDAFADLMWYHDIEIVALYCVVIRADTHSMFLGSLPVKALLTELEASHTGATTPEYHQWQTTIGHKATIATQVR